MPDNPRRSGQSGRTRQPSGARKQPAAGSAPRQRKKQPQTKWGRAVTMVIATVLGCFFLSFLILQGASDLFGLEQDDLPVTVTIPEGASWGDVAGILGNANVISQKATFRMYVGSKKDDEGRPYAVKSGEYPLNSNMGYDQIISFIRTGNAANESVRLTFIEGMTLAEIAAMLEENKVCTAENLFEYIDSTEFTYSFYEEMLPLDSLRFRSLEGYFFPDTYEFFTPEKPSSIVSKFLDNFSTQITTDMRRRMDALDMTLDETITLASVIQREAGTPSEMRKVSAVFHNRLDAPQSFPRLQSDVTLFYAEDDIKPYLPNRQEVYDAYNTYVRTGLPVAPIANPGLEAITAALYPAENNFYYFVTDVEGNYYYSATLDQHNARIAEAAAADQTGEGTVHGINTQRDN